MRLRHAPSMLRTPTYEAYCAAHAKYASDRGEQVQARNEQIQMYANEGRWVGDCPYCNAGVTGHVEWPDVRCFGCSAIYADVVWPEDLDDIETELLVRPMLKQNWVVGESVETLAAENEARGIASPLTARTQSIAKSSEEAGS